MGERVVQTIHAEAWRARDARTPWEWAEQNIEIDKTSPFPGRFRSDTAPWTKELMEVFADNRVREISVMCSAQSAKTQTIMVLLAWAIAEDPGPAMWVMAAQDEAQTFCRTRLWPTLEGCKALEGMVPTERGAKKALEIDFASMPLVVTGAGSPSKLQSKPIRWLLLDEVRNYPPHALEMAMKRTRAFWNSRTVIISTPDMEKDSVHQAFVAGDQRRYHVACPECAHRFELEWERMKWDDTAFTRPDGEWLMDRVAETIRVECPKCEHRIYDRPQDRKALAASGVWVRHNPGAPQHRVSFTWNALIPTWVRWRSVVEEFLQAKRALAWRDDTKLKAFINETLGQPWEDRMKETRDWRLVEERKAGYQLRTHWELEERRFLTVDVQKNHFWYLCRAWARGGASRLIDFGRFTSFDELADLAADLRVAADDVAIDSGYEAQRVYSEIIKTGYRWKAFKGDHAPYYSIGGTRRPWTTTLVDPAMGTRDQGRKKVKLFLFSNPMTKDITAAHMRGLAAPWELPDDVSSEYLDQVTAEQRHERTDAKGRISYEWIRVRRDNHAFDLENMQVICALVTGMMAATPSDALTRGGLSNGDPELAHDLP